MAGILLIVGFVALVLAGLPVAFALLVPSIIYVIVEGFPSSIVTHTGIYSINKFTLLAIPMFVLAGSLMNTSGIARRLFAFAAALVGHWRGGLPQVNILASLIFAGSSGTALADIGGLGRMEIKAMTDRGYKKSFAAAVTMSSATVGPIFPPSVPLIVFAAVSDISAVQLLLAGIIPGILTTILLMAATIYISHKNNYPRGDKASYNMVLDTFKQAAPALLTPIILIAGMLSGIFTATEAAAVTVLYILFINIVVYQDFNWSHILESARETVKITSIILFIVIAASIFSRVLALEQMPQEVTRYLLTLSSNPLVLLLVANLLLLLVGMFLDMIGALLLLVPLLAPPLIMAGVDPVHLGLVVVFNLMIGAMTPPVGVTLYLVSHIAQEPVSRVMRESFPYFLVLLFALVVLTYVPWFSTVVPSLVR